MRYVYMCVYVCVYVYVYVCVYMCVCMCVCVVYIYVCMCVCMCVCTNIYVCMYIHTYVHTYMYMRIHRCVAIYENVHMLEKLVHHNLKINNRGLYSSFPQIIASGCSAKSSHKCHPRINAVACI